MWSRNLGVGLFLILGTALFALGVFQIGNQHNAFGKHFELFTEFRSLRGLEKGAKVRVAGFDAGEVTAISVPHSPSEGFRLTLRIDPSVHGLVRTDSVATIATEGLVGDKYVLIQPGSLASPEAASFGTIPSKETSDMTELLQKGTALIDNANGTMKVVSDKLATTLDAATSAINNTNDLVVGVKQGRGTVGMMLRDEKTAAHIREALENVRQATSSMNHASKQADALISDFQSRGLPAKAQGIISEADSIVSDVQRRNLGEKLDQTMENVHHAADNIDATTRQLHETIARALAPDAQGIEAGENIKQSLSNVNQATGNMADDTEALKHEFFFRGFFKKRGYFSIARLEPDKYRQDKVLANPNNPRVWIQAAELFEPGQDGSEILSRAGKVRIDAAVVELGDRAIGGAMIVEGYAASGAPGDQLATSRSRAILVRNYVHTRFQIDTQDVGIVPLRGVPPPATRKTAWNGVCIVLLPAIVKERHDQ
jgi:phospholipid/cholesterol/gamma-HCH transport system substrate-binding protein